MAHEALVGYSNAAATATLDPAGWAASAPVALVRSPNRARARSTATGEDGDPAILRGRFRRGVVAQAGVLGWTNAYQTHTTELRLYTDDAYQQLAWTSGRAPIIGSMVNPSTLPFRDERKFSGRLTADEFFAAPANIWRFPPAVYARSFEWRVWSRGIHKDLSQASGFEVDYLSLGGAIPFSLMKGAALGPKPGGSVDYSSGVPAVTPGTPRRHATIPMEAEDTDLVNRLVTLAQTVDVSTPVIWTPDKDSPRDTHQYGFIGRLSADGVERRYSYDGPLSDSQIALEEWR